MITKDKIDEYIDKIPPTPKALKDTLSLLNDGQLIKASKIAQTDLALSKYLKNLVNKPIYGFSHEVKDISQIFGILGVSGSQQTVYNYMTTLLSPAKWLLFGLNTKSFHELQARLSKRWELILKHLDIEDKNLISSITILPASIIVSEALFSQKVEDVKLLRSTKNLDYNTILTRLCGMGLFDICEQITIKWEMPKEIGELIQASSGLKPSCDEQINLLAKWMHLLLFYELSQPIFVEAGLNDFVDFQVDFVSDIYDDFAKLMEIG
ncbi:MAG: HDOD domain-containing protein [Sulfurimonas sp.]|uniref:HDOD domain-containing protein n=1 Tax=Sulfurimonas sp. TaxID=2022749 RepID=UPI0025F1EA09|nr:HDOD domain-containing protein [Sulfurimonas sp.]MCK9491800.1 HDOD domain-containing protein [Sulfurimonas sp.]